MYRLVIHIIKIWLLTVVREPNQTFLCEEARKKFSFFNKYPKRVYIDKYKYNVKGS